jgi:hypothetical protein
MLRLLKGLTVGTQVGLTLIALALAGGVREVQAAFVCTTTIVNPSTPIDDSSLVAGFCVQS